MKKERKNNKVLLIAVLALFLVFGVVSGTIAWLTATSTVTNTFTVGSINVPTTSPKDQQINIDIDGHIYEPSWDSTVTHKLIPAVTFDKDPYVGVGAGSEDTDVYVYVENNFSDKVYFSINTGWEAVEATVGFASGTYTKGLFKYTNGLSGAATSDVWTSTPLFSTIVVDELSTKEDLTVAEGKNSEIKISSFIHQSKDGMGQDIPDSTILAAAKAAFNIQ